MSRVGKEFMEKTKYQNLVEADQQRGLPQPPLELGYPEDAVVIDLPGVVGCKIGKMAIQEAIEIRKTSRNYSEVALTLEELSYLLWSTQGVKQVTSRPVTFRTVPSAGARHALETYLFINRVEGLHTGLYRYIATEHKLMVIDLSQEVAQRMEKIDRHQAFILNSAVTFIWSTVIYRMNWRYGERGYRYIHLDAGHVCQNLYLAAESIRSGVCAIAAFDDDKWNEFLGLDGEAEFVVYMATVGKR